MEKVIITQPVMGITHMQVCTVADATDEEILEVCNRDNPSGTTAGWTRVIHTDKDHPKCEPTPCESYPERIHYLVVC